MTIDSADDSKISNRDHQYESNLESDVRFEIESNHEASQVPSAKSCKSLLRPAGYAAAAQAHRCSTY